MKAKKSRTPTLAEKHDAALASLRTARKTIAALRSDAARIATPPSINREILRASVTVAALTVLEAHGIQDARIMAENIATRVAEAVTALAPVEVPA